MDQGNSGNNTVYYTLLSTCQGKSGNNTAYYTLLSKGQGNSGNNIVLEFRFLRELCIEGGTVQYFLT